MSFYNVLQVIILGHLFKFDERTHGKIYCSTYFTSKKFFYFLMNQNETSQPNVKFDATDLISVQCCHAKKNLELIE